MIEREKLIQSVGQLRDFLVAHPDEISEVRAQSHAVNPWFIPKFTDQAMQAIIAQFLDPVKWSEWLSTYGAPAITPKTVGIIMAGNLPLVGFHDLLCVLASGHRALIKLSDKDSYLLPWLTDHWIRLFPELSGSISYAERLDGFDAVIATGSNNSARYFEYYFSKYPHILRRNRNGVAILSGEETVDDLKLLARDIFLFFGMGCRNVSKLWVPRGYDFSIWQEALADWDDLKYHNKYGHNLEYNSAIYIINNVPNIHLGSVILKEDESIASRIGCLHYSYYDEPEALHAILQLQRQDIQCVVSKSPIVGWEHVSLGQSQAPRLDQYADGVDTMAFLSAI